MSLILDKRARGGSEEWVRSRGDVRFLEDIKR